MDGYFFQQFLRQNLRWFLSKHWRTLFLRGFILKPTERALILLKIGTRDFQNIPPFGRSFERFERCFYGTITRPPRLKLTLPW